MDRWLLCLTGLALLAPAGAAESAREGKMRSLTDMPERHVTIARSEEDYISFPDVCLTRGGRLLCAYRVADAHVAKRSRLEVKSSDDRGKTWSAPHVLAPSGHCPRFSLLEDGTVLLLCDGVGGGTGLFRSEDEGRTWSAPTSHPFRHGIPDRPLRIGPNSLLTAAHRHIGKAPSPIIGQATTEQVMYRSDDLGKSWFEWALLACDPNLVLCEVSQFRMPDGSLRAYLRENSGVQEPTYRTASFDEGKSWTPVEGTPMIGHRPCAGLLRSGKVLVTYRHVGLDGGNRAWLGDPDAMPEYAVSAFDPGTAAKLTPEGLVVENDEGGANALLYSLRPITDPRLAKAELEAELVVERSEGAHLGIHLGCTWSLFPDRVEANVKGADPVAVDATRPHRYRFTYDRGKVALSIDGTERRSLDLPAAGVPLDRNRRPVRVGNVPERPVLMGLPRFTKNAGRSVWRSLRLRIEEPRYRIYEWSWSPRDGFPNQYEVDHILELRNDRQSSPGDFGYSGWVQFPDGEAFCVVHYKGDAKHSYVVGTWIRESDFGPRPTKGTP